MRASCPSVQPLTARPFAMLCRGLVGLCLAVVLTACSSTEEPDYVDRPAEELFAEAEALFADRDFQEAAIAYEEVERQHPYSELATEAQLQAATAYYQGRAYEEAIGAARRFIDLHPGHSETPYAYYLIGVSYYDRISDVGRDQEMTREALTSFEELIRRYPDEDYARDARLKVDLAVDHLAGKEMDIGRYYLNQQQYLAAINRFRNVVDFYQTTSHVPEALLRLIEAYLSLGLRSEARETAAVLGHNYPGSRWYERAYALLETEDLRPATEPRGLLGWF